MNEEELGEEIKVGEEVVTIPRRVYRSMLRDLKKLSYLENAGVDNWEWYDDAREAMIKWADLDE